MKKYSTREVEDDINHVEWVPAEVAQGLYEALSDVLFNYDVAPDGAKWETTAYKALAAADGEKANDKTGELK